MGKALGLAVFLLFVVPAGVDAHHSTAVFDVNKRLEVRGTLIDFKLRNPHSSFVIEGVGFIDGVPQGTGPQRWEIESDATAAMRTSGIAADTFKPGDRMTIVALPHKQAGFRFGHAVSLTTADGKKYLFGFRGSNRIYSPSLRRVLATGAPQRSAPPVSASLGIQRIAGRWQQPLTIRGSGPALPLNQAGAAARLSYDPKRSPANTCEPINVPDVYNAPFFLLDVRLDKQRAIIKHELYDIERTVPLTGETAPADPSGRFGVVSGRIEGSTLVVESHRYPPSKWGLGIATQVLGNGGDVPSSEQKVVTERFSVSEDGRTLNVDYTVYDPVYMSRPYSSRVQLTRVPEDTQMYPYHCDLESAAMWSRNRRDPKLRVGPAAGGHR